MIGQVNMLQGGQPIADAGNDVASHAHEPLVVHGHMVKNNIASTISSIGDVERLVPQLLAVNSFPSQFVRFACAR